MTKSKAEESSTPLGENREGASASPPLINDKHHGPASTPLQAGRALDALIAEKVMGWDDVIAGRQVIGGVSGKRPDDPLQFWRTVPFYSTDIAAAWQVLEMLSAPGFWVNIKADGAGQFTVEWMTHGEQDEDYWLAEVTDVDSAPLAICLAALRETR